MTGLQFAGLLLALISTLLLVPTLVFGLQVGLALLGGGGGVEGHPPASRPRLAVLMPAHDESAGIAAAIATIRPQLASGDRLLVVADNCADDTASVAATAGAEVVSRLDPLRRGKGHALDFGVRALEADPPDVVVIVDADCAVAPGSLERLGVACSRYARPVQALYLMRSPSGAALRTRVAEFAWIVRNHVRPLGWLHLGLPCQLMGTGMAFPWPLLREAALASSHLVEDLQLGLDLAVAGTPPLFCPEASVTSMFPAQADATAAQRTRWEHGHFAMIASAGPRLLWRGIRQGRPALVAMALDLCVPPLAALVLMLSVCVALSLCLGWAGGSWGPALVGAGASALLGLAVSLAWRRFGRGSVTLRELFGVPAYVLAKLPIYAQLLRKRQVDWVRTKRDEPRE